MKTISIMLMFLMTSVVLAEPKIEIMSELAKQVNAYTTNNRIPWYKSKNEDHQVKIIGKLDNLVPLVRTTHGNYHYILYRIRFHRVKVHEGEFQAKELTFYLERRFPTKKSGIKLKELWPFQKGVVLTFMGYMAKGKLHIISIKKETQPEDALDKK